MSGPASSLLATWMWSSEHRRTASGSARTPGGGEASLGTLPDQTALELASAPNM